MPIYKFNKHNSYMSVEKNFHLGTLWYNISTTQFIIDGLSVVLIFVIIRMQWTDGAHLELRVRNKNCQPHSYYKDSIKQVVLFFRGGVNPPSKKHVRVTSQNES